MSYSINIVPEYICSTPFRSSLHFVLGLAGVPVADVDDDLAGQEVSWQRVVEPLK